MKKLKLYLLGNSISMKEFSERIGKPYASLYCWVSGRSTPSLKTALLIEKATKKSVTVYDWV